MTDPAAPIRDPLTGEPYQAHCRGAIDAVRGQTMVAYVGLVSLYQQVLHCERHGIAGALVECGVWKGGSCAIMAAANIEHSHSRRPIHAFDAFDDICEPDAAVDGDAAVALVRRAKSPDAGAEGRLRPVAGIYDDKGGPGSVEACRSLIVDRLGYPAESLHCHRGWFQDTVPEAAERIGPIAILRLDGDWYASTKVCLDHLWDHVVPGGFVVIDDYGAYAGCRKAVDEFREARGIRSYLHYVNPDIRYLVK